MITISFGSTSVKQYDKEPLASHYESFGLSLSSFQELNQFVYAALPEGSHGKILVKASDARLLGVRSKVTLTISGQAGTFVHNQLLVTNIQYISTPIFPGSWSLTPTDPKTIRLAIVELKDIWCGLDAIIQKDYNRVTIINPVGLEVTTEPEDDDLQTYQQILNSVVTDHAYAGVPTVTIQGVPTVSINQTPKPHNLLWAGSTVKDAFQSLADALFLVCYVEASSTGTGTIRLTNAQSESVLYPPKNQLVFSRYGSEPLPDNLITTFSQQGHPLSRQRTTVLRDYYINYNQPWANKTNDIAAIDDIVLANNPRYGNSELNHYHYFPYYETGTFNTTDTNVNAINEQLAINLARRTMRTISFLYKDIVLVTPSATIQRVVYKMTDKGMMTTIESLPPRKVSAPPMLNHVARGFEYVPPMIQVRVVPNSASDPRGGHAPGTYGDYILPDVGDGTHTVRAYNGSTQQNFDNDYVHLFYHMHYRRYEYTERLIRHFQYLLLSDWNGGLAVARRYTMDGSNTGKSVLLRDPLGIFQYQNTGDSGYMFYSEEDKWYAIQAPCDASAPSEPEGLIGACIFQETCFIANESYCNQVGGTYQGDGTTCG